MDTDAAEAVVPERRTRDDVVALFAVTWALATLFHVWGPSGAAFGLFDHRTDLALWQALAGIVAVALLVRPRSRPLLAALALLGPITLWYEMPIAGSHWVLACLVDVAFLLALVAARAGDRLESIFVPLARWVLIGFYFFAAFAKLNHSFFTPAASCGNFYFDELAGSLHLSVQSATAGWWSHLVPLAVAATEMSIPILLCIRRTRYVGVVVGLLFHGLLVGLGRAVPLVPPRVVRSRSDGALPRRVAGRHSGGVRSPAARPVEAGRLTTVHRRLRVGVGALHRGRAGSRRSVLAGQASAD